MTWGSWNEWSKSTLRKHGGRSRSVENHNISSGSDSFQGLVVLTNRWDALSCYPRHNCQGPGMEHLGECHA